MDERIAYGNLQTVYEKLYDARTKWDNLGLALGVEDEDLCSIEKINADSVVCLRKMLTQRLQAGGPLTWKGLCKGLRCRTVRRNDVAESIEQWIQGPCTTALAQQNSSNCPKRLHTPIRSQSPLLAQSQLDVSDGTLEQNVLKEDVRELQKVCGNLHRTLRKILPSIPEIEHHLGDYLDENGTGLSFNVLYTKIKSCCTLLDVDVLRTIADDTIVDGTQKKKVDQAFKAYDECLKDMLTRRVFAFPGGLTTAELGEGESELTVTIKVHYLKADIATVKRIKELITRIFNIPPKAHLKILRARAGSMEVTFAISKKKGYELFSGSLGLKQMKELASGGITMVAYESRVIYCSCKLSTDQESQGLLKDLFEGQASLNSPMDDRVADHHPDCLNKEGCGTISCTECGESFPQCGIKHHQTFACLSPSDTETDQRSTSGDDRTQQEKDAHIRQLQATVDHLQAEKQEQYAQVHGLEELTTLQQEQLEVQRREIERLSGQLGPLSLVQGTVRPPAKLYPHVPRLRVPYSIDFNWRRCKDTPGDLIVYSPPETFNERFYARGLSYNIEAETVLEYTPSSDQWDELPNPSVEHFTVTTLNGQLLAVGGDVYNFNKELKTANTILSFNERSRQWVQSYPAMPRALSTPAVVGYQNYLVVAGGHSSEGSRVADVNILDTSTNKWIEAESLPLPGTSIYRTVLIGDTVYLVGQDSSCVRAHVPTLVLVKSDVWETLSDTPFYFSTPVAVDNTLLAVGGSQNGSIGSKLTTSIHMYDPNSNQWTKVGDLPQPMQCCPCTVFSGELFVLGSSVFGGKLSVQ